MNFNRTLWIRRQVQPFAGWFVALTLVVGLGAMVLSSTLPVVAQSAATPTETPDGFYYTVRRGEYWGLIAERFGKTVRELKAANPQLVRYGDVLRVGDELLIPGAPPPTATPLPNYEEYVVKRGEGWSTIAQKYGVRLRDLFEANPDLVRYDYILFTGDRVRVPLPAAADAAPAATPTVLPTVAPTEEPAIEEATPEEAIEEEAVEEEAVEEEAVEEEAAGDEAVEEDIAEEEAAETETEESDIPSEEPVGVACPADFADFPAAIGALLEAPDADAAAVTAFLADCDAAVEGGVRAGEADLVVVYANPATTGANRQTDLLIFNKGAQGYTQTYRARAGGAVTLFALDDINRDAQPDVVWVDRTCGASTCFDTIEVISWDGDQWLDWTDGSITMAFADIRLEDVTPAGQGQELVLEGGVYGSVGAGPQRARTETWGSVDGAPYTLLDQVNAASNCLYHVVLDANEALLSGDEQGLATAEALYTKAATDTELEACWTRDDELDELRSFSLFRLALVAAYQGQPGGAVKAIESLGERFEGAIYDQVGQNWLAAYESYDDIATACGVVSRFASANPAAYEILADYGYANPSFSAAEVCPILDIEVVAAEPSQSATPTPATATPPPTDASLPACPADLSGYAALLPAVIAASGSDELVIETWLRQCDAMSDERGGFLLVDANGDGAQDAIFWPTVVSDLGFGPDGAQGDLLIFHGDDAGVFTLAVDEEIYGQPTLLAAEDLTGDGKLDLAWQVVGCSTFCVLEVQVVQWDGSTYVTMIQPGATIAEGEAQFAPVAEGDPGSGQQLVLTGGVSGAAEGGLAVPHTEVWQSVDGGPFHRLRWTYDRTVEGNDCMGLRLVEADVALQAAAVLGYQQAIDHYIATIDPTLKACSIFGLNADEELVLLQGFATFRLIQAEALGGDLENARADLAALTGGQPDSDYTKAATQWLTAFEANRDAAAACQSILAIFTENAMNWQITDHFGYNHPALAAEQICFQP
ncbi:MAG: LysM peptidoglycan-binding domain-containing protein [Caldilineaceae bacterium]|nr:LysM peptidoglycan-binding domain-containing protein [Caldilineaceae bacterium]